LPRAQAAVEGIVAAAEVLGLRSPSSGRHQSVKSWGCGGKAPVRFPLKSRNSAIYKLFAALARRTRAGEDVFEYLGSLARKQEAGKLAKLSKYIELKPKIFGISLDVGAILDDLGARAESQ